MHASVLYHCEGWFDSNQHLTGAAINPLNFEINWTFDLELTASNIHYIFSVFSLRNEKVKQDWNLVREK